MEKNNEPEEMTVKTAQLKELLQQLETLTKLASQADKVTSAIGKFIPGLFTTGNAATFNMSQIPGLLSQLQKDSNISKDCAELGKLLTEFKSKYDLASLAAKYNKVVNG